MSDALAFKAIAVRRMAGLDAGFALDELSPGINVIYGPNGVGKSRTAWAINLALWPACRAAHRDSVAARIQIGPDLWAVEVDGDDTRYHRNGNDSTAPPLPDPKARDRYNLPLQDLLSTDGEDFARAILHESAGGFNLAGAAESLNLDKKPFPRWGKVSQSLDDSVRQVRAVQNRLEAIARQERELGDLIAARDRAREAAARYRSLSKALEHARAVEQHGLALVALQSFPAEMASLAGNERDILNGLRRRVEDLESERERLGEEIKVADQMLAQSRLPMAAIDATLPSTLARQSQRLAELRSAITSKRSEIQSATARREEARRVIGDTVADEHLQKLDVRGLARLAEFSRQAEQVRAERVAAEALASWIGDARSNIDVTAYQNGLLLLGQWLRVPRSAAEVRPELQSRAGNLFLAASGLVVLMALMLAWRVHWSFALFSLGPPLLYLLTRRSPAAEDPAEPTRRLIERSFFALAIDPPTEWTSNAVEQRWQQLLDHLEQAKIEREKADRWSGLQSRREALLRDEQAMAAQRKEMIAALGVAPVTDAAVLHALVNNIIQWQQAQRELAAANAQVAHLSAEYQQQWEAAIQGLRAHGYSPAELAELDASIEDLRGRMALHQEGSRRRETALKQLEVLDRAQSDLTAQVAALFASVGLIVGDEQTLQQWIDRRAERLETERRVNIAEARVRELAASLAAEPQALQMSASELEVQLNDAQELAATADELTEKIAAVRQSIESAKQSSDLEEALARKRDCADALVAARDHDCELAAGWALAEHLRRVSRERHRPAVFRRARDLLARITQGRYRLEFDEAEEPAFRAVDSTNGFGLSLDELSSGARVQLLLAVRVAFVEQQEQGPRLPILLDETLANSDESRARQIIDATLEICRSGRQIFYFTAQPDEVGKWQEVLAGTESMPHKLIDLAAVRNLAASERTPLRQIRTMPAIPIPLPDGMDRQAYGNVLAVPGIDPMREEIGGVHLWHLLDDMSLLYRLMKAGVNSWGQWQTLKAQRGVAPDGYAGAEARARLLENLGRCFRIGCGRPVDKQAILDCSAVTERFRSDVIALAAAEQGDARRLMRKIESKVISGFRSTAAQALREYLEANGYLDVRQPLSVEEIRSTVIALAQADLESGSVTPEHLDEYLTTAFVRPDSPLAAALA